MADQEKLVVVVTNGFNDERASVAWSIANGGVGSGMQVTMFLVSSGVDWVDCPSNQTSESTRSIGMVW